MIEAKWAVEIEHTGKGSPDYFSIYSLLVDEDGIHVQVVDGPAVDFARDSIRKLLVMRVKDTGKRSAKESFITERLA
jgi:hypothetical protein